MSADEGIRPPDELATTRFAIVPEWVLREPSHIVKLYAILDRYANKDRRLWPGQEELAERMGCSVRSVKTWMKTLREIGALDQVRRRYNGSTIYALRRERPERWFPTEVHEAAPHAELGAESCPTEVQQAAPPLGSPVPTNESHEREPLNESHSPVGEVFQTWKQSTSRGEKTVLDDKRSRLIAKALKDYPLPDVLDAVRGWERSEYHRGKNDAGKVYNDLSLLLRDAEHIERFRDLYRGTGTKPVPKVRVDADGVPLDPNSHEALFGVRPPVESNGHGG